MAGDWRADQRKAVVVVVLAIREHGYLLRCVAEQGSPGMVRRRIADELEGAAEALVASG